MKKSSSLHTTLFRFIAALVVIVPLVFIIDCLEKEQAEYRNAHSTLSKYTSKQVCANSTKYNIISTVKSSKEARKRNMKVVHCGECGECSTSNDIQIMHETRETLTKTATMCSLNGLLFGEKVTEKCLEDEVGFTAACSKCWSDNIRCTSSKCRLTCLKSFLFKEPNNYDGNLNSCLECDEKLCGPAFLKCAGANRRRLGIVSDIARDSKNEQCNIL